MSEHETWLKKTLADILGEDRGIPDYMIDRMRKFRPDDLSELRTNERQAVWDAFRRVAHQSRDARGGELGEGEDRPAYVDGDMDWGLRAAKAALEAIPAGERSQKATQLLSECTCPAAVGPNPGIDGGSSARRPVESALDRSDPTTPDDPLPY
ncbi:hypothetical protein [Jannaschia rubra]|uniref:Uncharacterized protein n=1 Tax=Jannaschia rubra TaxID=282197 RepID=A0A0M6XTD9_9RHOB|nr:hypothetical protein [Jannaschia rubra]CTQ33491.1 hypothetical protein JAN5088_02273 [Jannaschia rubra]SFG02690.1 hypothetical protein SAMN04488517_102321 [Jannaschia rubra]